MLTNFDCWSIVSYPSRAYLRRYHHDRLGEKATPSARETTTPPSSFTVSFDASEVPLGEASIHSCLGGRGAGLLTLTGRRRLIFESDRVCRTALLEFIALAVIACENQLINFDFNQC